MVDSASSGINNAKQDRRPGIAVCAYDPADEIWDLAEDLSGAPWSPAGARTIPVSGDDPDALAAQLCAQLKSGECRAALLVGRARKPGGFQIQMRAENRVLGHKERLTLTGPGVARTTAPVADMVRDLRKAGLVADASSDAENDAGSYVLYRVLSDLPDAPLTPSVGLLRAPPQADQAAMQKAIKAAVTAMAHHLSPQVRA